MNASISFSKHGVKNKQKKTNKNIMEKIIKEYQLKRNNFNPDMKSPDFFGKRLQQRMRLYYSSLVNS